jgi:hypothetical protein
LVSSIALCISSLPIIFFLCIFTVLADISSFFPISCFSLVLFWH